MYKLACKFNTEKSAKWQKNNRLKMNINKLFGLGNTNLNCLKTDDTKVAYSSNCINNLNKTDMQKCGIYKLNCEQSRNTTD